MNVSGCWGADGGKGPEREGLGGSARLNAEYSKLVVDPKTRNLTIL